MSRPATSVREKPSTNGAHAPSLNRRLTSTGGNMVRLNIISNSPKMRCTTVQFKRLSPLLYCEHYDQIKETSTENRFSRCSILRLSVINKMT